MKEGYVSYESNGQVGKAFCVRPKEPEASVVVVHEVWGFSQHIQDVCRSIGALGFTALAPLLYWRDSVLFESNKIRSAMKVVWDLSLPERYDRQKLELTLREKHASEESGRLLRTLYDGAFRERMLSDVLCLAASVAGEGRRVGAVGFSMGGGLVLRLAARSRQLRVCVAFSSEPPDDQTVRRIRSPILMFYGSEDSFMTRGLPLFVENALKHGRDFTIRSYASAGHEFFNPEDGGYDEDAATDSWALTTIFLNRTLRDGHDAEAE